MSIPDAWSCLECPESGTGPDSDLAARKHGDASGHGTTTHLDRPEWERGAA